MMAPRLAKVFLSVFFFLASVTLRAQDVAGPHFIYMQTENNQPFYVRLNGKVFSSTSGGYVILPKLASGDYRLFAGFPRNEFPEQEFRISISGANEGFLLKKLQGGWSLFNIETMALTEGKPAHPVDPVKETQPKKIDADPFATLLAGAVKDSSILENEVRVLPTSITKDSTQVTIIQPSKPAIDSSASVVNTPIRQDSSSDKVTGIANNPVEKESPLTKPPSDSAVAQEVNKERPSKNAEEKTVRRILLVNEVGGLELMYVDRALKDTIRIFMPVAATNEVKSKTAKVLYNPPAKDTAGLTITPTIIADNRSSEKPEVVVQQESKPETQGQIIYNPQKVNEVENAPSQEENSKTEESTTDNASTGIGQSGVNSDCHNFATNKDFLKLRKKMAAETDNDKMIEVARKYFRNTCYSTEQIRNLSYLFLSDEGRYKFFDAAYPFTSDSNQYSTLESQLKDPYFINRFRAMIHK